MFKIIKKSNISKARYGELKTGHGILKTPCFLPDATRGVVKLIGIEKDLGVEAMVVNTFHLYLQPGAERVGKLGGMHEFMSWDRPLVSDSGGYQVFSLAHKNGGGMGKISDKGVIFKSPIDGSKHELTPEKSIRIQFGLGTDIAVLFDDCPPNDYDRDAIRASVDRTISWAKRCRQEYDKLAAGRNKKPLLLAVIQGGIYKEERERCAGALKKIGFDGYGFGARPVDKEGNFLFDVLDFTADLIPENNFRFGLGIGTPDDIVRCAAMGWDIFDCVIPTREGRHGRLFYRIKNKRFMGKGSKSLKFYDTANITNSKFALDKRPINPESRLEALRIHSKAYLHHLFKIKEPLGARLAALNNLEFYTVLTEDIRKEIGKGEF